MDSFDNPATAEEEAAQEKEDTNAVPSPTPRDLALCRLGSAFYGSTPGAVFAALTTVYFCFMLLTMGTRSTAENPDSKLRLLSDITFVISIPFNTIGGAAWSLRRVTAQDGELQLLGAGETKISARALRGLRRAQALLWIPFTIFALLGLLCFVTATKVGTRSKITGNIITEDYAKLVVGTGFFFLCIAFAVFPWWLTLKVAAVLASDFVAEVRQAIERCSPTAPEWEAEVLLRRRRVDPNAPARPAQSWSHEVFVRRMQHWLRHMDGALQYRRGQKVQDKKSHNSFTRRNVFAELFS